MFSPLNITEMYEQEVLKGIKQSRLIKASSRKNWPESSTPFFDLPFMDQMDYL